MTKTYGDVRILLRSAIGASGESELRTEHHILSKHTERQRLDSVFARSLYAVAAPPRALPLGQEAKKVKSPWYMVLLS